MRTPSPQYTCNDNAAGGCVAAAANRCTATHFRYDLIRDYARAMFIIYDLDKMATLIHLLRTAAGFTLVRGKNRFAPEYVGSDSAGYRDFQLVVRTPDNWLIEIQIIPKEMYDLKETLGHRDYTKYRHTVEAMKRAREVRT